MNIRPYHANDMTEVIAIWQATQLVTQNNNPQNDIERKLLVDPDLFLVAELESQLVGTVMAGYEGHRGWINYLAVKPSFQRRGIATTLMQAAEARLSDKGCPKINLQVRDTNTAVIDFYRALGYQTDAVVSLGKRFEN